MKIVPQWDEIRKDGSKKIDAKTRCESKNRILWFDEERENVGKTCYSV